MDAPENDSPPKEATYAVARHVIEVVSPPLDIALLERLLKVAFGASAVVHRATVVLKEQGQPKAVRLSALAQRIMGLLADGRGWRSKHIIERAADGLSVEYVRQELDILWEKGLIEKVRSGVWILAGVPHPDPKDIPPLNEEGLAASHRRVLDLIGDGIEASELQTKLKVSRQRVDQMLKRLLRVGAVKRIEQAGSSNRWLWLKSDVNPNLAKRRHANNITKSQASLLGALEPEAFHWIEDVAKVLEASKQGIVNRIEALEAVGLVVSFRLGQRRYVGLSARGLSHPSRRGDSAPVRAKTADLSNAFGPARIQVTETLAVLGEARTLELTAAMVGAEGDGASLLTGQLVARLLSKDLVAPVPNGGGLQPTYKLTDAGRFVASLIARFRTPPDKAELESRIERYKQQRLLKRRERAAVDGAPAGAASPAQAAVLELLKAGPLSTPEIAAAVSEHLRNPRSANLMLRSLSDRGLVTWRDTKGRAKVWELTY